MKKNQDEMRAQLMALAVMQENRKKGNILKGAVGASSGILRVTLAFFKWMVLTAIALCIGVCKLCFGFFFH